MNSYGLTYHERIARVASEIRLLLPWLPPHQAAVYAAQFVQNGARS